MAGLREIPPQKNKKVKAVVGFVTFHDGVPSSVLLGRLLAGLVDRCAWSPRAATLAVLISLAVSL